MCISYISYINTVKMIIELTKDNLQNCGFDNEEIDRLIEWDNHASFLFKDTCYYANNIEKKIYTEIDGFRKYYLENGTISFPMDCPDLIPNYFDLALKNYLDKQILLLNTMFVEADQKKKFVLNEIEKIKSSIEVLKQDLKIKILIRDNKKKQIDILDSYLNFLKIKLNELPQQNETSKPYEKFKTQNLFKVGLLFAKGEMNKYFTVNSKNETVMNNEYTAPKIAKELGNDSYNKYILASINNYKDKENGNKNIFNSLDMMTRIISHCEAEKIPVDNYFKSRLPIE